MVCRQYRYHDNIKRRFWKKIIHLICIWYFVISHNIFFKFVFIVFSAIYWTIRLIVTYHLTCSQEIFFSYAKLFFLRIYRVIISICTLFLKIELNIIYFPFIRHCSLLESCFTVSHNISNLFLFHYKPYFIYFADQLTPELYSIE